MLTVSLYVYPCPSVCQDVASGATIAVDSATGMSTGHGKTVPSDAARVTGVSVVAGVTDVLTVAGDGLANTDAGTGEGRRPQQMPQTAVTGALYHPKSPNVHRKNDLNLLVAAPASISSH